MYVNTTSTSYWRKISCRLCIFLSIFYILLSFDLHAQQLAFPGAEGGGRFATGGRGGTVYEVTNLNDSGPGSLRDGISQPNRTIVFKVSGVIHLNSKLSIAKNNITIAGQTAPGDGICITGYTVNIKASNIIIRYIRCRLSDVNNIEDDAMNSFSGPYENIIIDHCSLSWSVDETGTFYGIKNFTLQWCMLTESLYASVHDKGNHGYGGIWGGENASFHHNLLAHHTSRNPRFGGSRFTGRPDLEVVDFRNNVIYNWASNSTYGGEGGNYNMINNYYKAGPATSGNLTTSSASNKRNRILNYTSYYAGTDAAIYPDTVWGGKFYIDGNYVYGYPDVTADNWTKGVQKDSYARAAELMAAARQSVPFSTAPVTTQTAEEAFASVLAQAGASLPKRDAIDSRIISEVANGTATYEGAAYAAINGTGISHPSGIIDTQANVGGLPAYNSAVPLEDNDHDGMGDTWEVSSGLNPNDSSDGNTLASNGYTNLENYLNSINGPSPNIAISGGLGYFAQNIGSPSASQTYNVSAEGLVQPLVITPPANFQISDNGGSTWFSNSSPLSLIPTNGVVSATITVRLNATTAGDFSGNITHLSSGLAPVNVAVSGATSQPASLPAGTAVVVAKDGSGNFTTVQAAINAAPTGRTTPYIIYIKNGKYKEKINIPSNKPFIQLYGESVAYTILTFDDYSGKPMPGGGTFGTSNSASVTINATDFSAINITFENSTGDAPQALAINVNADRASFKNCRFLGGQDTVLTNGAGRRNYFKNCYIDGVVDFIFGAATAVFDSCVIYPKSRADGGKGGYVTAANTPDGQGFGYVFRNCIIPANTGVTSYVLGRPWQNSCGSSPVSYPKVVFLNSSMAYTIKPEGWSTWDACTNTSSIFYAEYKTLKTNGELANVSSRVPWSFQLTDSVAATYTNANIFGGWNPCSVFADCSSAKPLVVSNFKAKKGTSTSAFNWNLSWPITGVKYELFRSSDKVSFTKINEQTEASDTTINFNYSEAIPGPGITYYYFVKASKAGLASHFTDTVQISSTPTITTTGSLSPFLQGLGLPSGAQLYTVSGASLTESVTIRPPAGFEVSKDGDSVWYNNSNPLVLAQSAGTIATTKLLVRLNADVAGSYIGDIIHTSAGADTVKLAMNGTVQSEPLPVSVPLLYFPMDKNNSDSSTFRASGVMPSTTTLKKLYVSNGAIVAPYSSSQGQAFSPSATGDGFWTTASGGTGSNLNRTYYEEFTVKGLPGYSVKVDSFLIKSSFISSQSGTKLAVVYSKSGFVSDSANVTGGIGPDGPLLSSANGGFTTPILLVSEGSTTTKNYKLALAGAEGVSLAEGQTLTIRTYFSCGSTSTGRFAKVKDVYIKGFVKSVPKLAISGSLSSFSQIIGSPSSYQSFTIAGQGLTNIITVVPPANFEISSDGGTTWFNQTSPLILAPQNGMLDSTDVFVRLNSTQPGSYSGSIAVSGGGALSTELPVSGVVSNLPSLAVYGSLTPFSQTIGTPSQFQSYSITGKYLVDSVTIKPPAGVQVSLDGNIWASSSLIISPANGSVDSVTVFVRLNADLPGNYSGEIINETAGVAPLKIPVSGVASNPLPVLAVSGTLDLFNQKFGAPSSAQSYTISGTNLIGNVTILPPANYQVSANGGVNWFSKSSPLILVPVNGTLATTTILVRLYAPFIGNYSGSISNTTSGVDVQNVEVTGITSSKKTAQIIVSGVLQSFQQTLGTPSAVQTYTISGVNLSSSISLKTPRNYEISSNGGNTWIKSSSTLQLTPLNGIVTPTVISVRLNASTIGFSLGAIDHSTKGASPVAVLVLGYTGRASNTRVSLEEEAEIIINPNPVENVFALVHPLSGDGAEINIYDVVGNRQMTFKVGDGLNISNFDISKLKSGEYILEYLDDETRLLKKLIKQ